MILRFGLVLSTVALACGCGSSSGDAADSTGALTTAPADEAIVTYGALKGFYGTYYFVDGTTVYMASDEGTDDAPHYALYARDVEAKQPARKIWEGGFIHSTAQDATTIYILMSEKRGMGKRTLWALPKRGGAAVARLSAFEKPVTDIAVAKDADVIVLGDIFANSLSVTTKTPGEVRADVVRFDGPTRWKSDGRFVFVNEVDRSKLSVHSIDSLGTASPKIAFERPSDQNVTIDAELFSFDATADSFFARGTLHEPNGATQVIVEGKLGAAKVTKLDQIDYHPANVKVNERSVCFSASVTSDEIACLDPGATKATVVLALPDDSSRFAIGQFLIASDRMFWTRGGALFSRKL